MASLQAFVASDAGAARAVAGEDGAVDPHYHGAVDERIRRGREGLDP